MTHRLYISLFWAIFFAFNGTVQAQGIEDLMGKRTRGKDNFTAANINKYRSTKTVQIGKVHIYNDGVSALNVQLFHSDAPEYPFSSKVVEKNKEWVFDFLLGSDWGIRFEIMGAQSNIFFIGNACKFEQTEFRIRYSDQ